MLNRLLKKTAIAMSLVEVVVAIGVSTVTLTTAAVFSTRLIIRAQENFLQESSTQLQNIVAEQLRLIEVDMQVNKSVRSSNPSSTQEPFAFNATGSNFTWINKGGGLPFLCDTLTTTDLYITLPDFTKAQTSIPINLQTVASPLAGTVIDGDKGTPGENYKFYKIQPSQRTGAFVTANTDLYLAIQKTVEVGNSATGLGDSLVFKIVTRYNVLNQVDARYSQPLEIKMVKSLVCP